MLSLLPVRRRLSVAQRQVLSDGTTVYLRDITFGTVHQYSSPVFRWQTLLPWNQVSPTVTPNDTLEAWIDRRVTRTDRFVSNSEDVTITDSHGCLFNSSVNWGSANSVYEVGGYVFDVFPRRESKLNLRVINSSAGGHATEFQSPNPAPKQFPEWTAEALPCTHSEGELTVTLKQLQSDLPTAQHPVNRATLNAEFSFRERGKPSNGWGWEIARSRLYDPTGNVSDMAPCLLCPFEPVWRFEAHFFRTGYGQFTPEETWVVRKMPVPGPGKSSLLTNVGECLSLPIRLRHIAGAGCWTYTDGKPTGFRKWVKGRSGFSVSSSSGGVSSLDVETSGQHIVIDPVTLPADTSMIVWLVDQSGKHYEPNMASSGCVYAFALPPTARTVDVHFAVVKDRVVSFLVKPPMPRRPKQ